jgi:hypothetical protein
VNHRVFERTLRPPVSWRACLFERHFHPQALPGVGGLRTQPLKDSGGPDLGPERSTIRRSGRLAGSGRKPLFYKVDLGSGRNTR